MIYSFFHADKETLEVMAIQRQGAQGKPDYIELHLEVPKGKIYMMLTPEQLEQIRNVQVQVPDPSPKPTDKSWPTHA